MLRRLLGPIGILCALAGAWLLLQNLHQLGELAFVPGLLLLVGWCFLILPARAEPPPEHWMWTLLGTTVAVAIGLFFRFRYFWTVPIGYNFEPLNFVFFAHRLVTEKFPYIPYSWYAHTLYSYCIALAMLMCESELTAFRVASVAISLGTLVALYLCLGRLFGRRAAWIGCALLGSSYWHNFASRTGYHQPLLPLCQLLFVYGLMTGVQTQRWSGFLIAALGMILGFHAYWGFYVMPFMWLAFIMYLFVFHRALWRRTLLPMLGSGVLTILGLVPLALFFSKHREAFGYILRGFSPSLSAANSFSAKVIINLKFVLWALSGHPHALSEYGTHIDWAVACAAFVGLAIALRRFVASPAYASIVLLLAVNVAALGVTVSNHYYIIATLPAAFVLAAVGITTVIEEWSRLSRYATGVLTLVLLAGIGWQARRDYDEFFHHHIYYELSVPSAPPGAMYPLIDAIKELVRTRAVYVPREELGRDFDTQFLELGRRLPSYAFTLQTVPFDAATILFPRFQIGRAAGVDVLLPNGLFVQRMVLPAFRKLYPHLSADMILPPEPYFSENPTPVSVHIAIPRDDVAAYQGLQRAEASDAAPALTGFIFAPADGPYRFRVHDEAVQIRLHGTRVPAAVDDAGAPVLLEAGLHPIEISGVPANGPLGIEWMIDDAWHEIDAYCLQPGAAGAEFFASYLAHPGKMADFHFVERRAIAASPTVQDAIVNDNGSVDSVDRTKFMSYDTAGKLVRELSLSVPADYHVARLPSGTVVLDPRGEMYAPGSSGPAGRAPLQCGSVDDVVDGDRVVLLCGDGRLLATSGGNPAPSPLLGLDGGPLLQPFNLAKGPEGFYVADAQGGQLLLYDASGHLLRGRHVAHLALESEVEVDADDNLHVKVRGAGLEGGLKTYTPDGYLLFHPVTGLAHIFVRGDRDPVDTLTPRRLAFAKGRGVNFINGSIYVYEKRPVAAPR